MDANWFSWVVRQKCVNARMLWLLGTEAKCVSRSAALDPPKPEVMQELQEWGALRAVARGMSARNNRLGACRNSKRRRNL